MFVIPECPICLEDPSSDSSLDVSAVTCGHVFHTECITYWMTKSSVPTCPSCRRDLRGSPVIKLFVDQFKPPANVSPAHPAGNLLMVPQVAAMNPSPTTLRKRCACRKGRCGPVCGCYRRRQQDGTVRCTDSCACDPAKCTNR